MARIPAELGMRAEELDELMSTSWNMRVATVGPGERINLTPLWFGWAGVLLRPRSEDRQPKAQPGLHCPCRSQRAIRGA